MTNAEANKIIAEWVGETGFRNTPAKHLVCPNGHSYPYYYSYYASVSHGHAVYVKASPGVSCMVCGEAWLDEKEPKDFSESLDLTAEAINARGGAVANLSKGAVREITARVGVLTDKNTWEYGVAMGTTYSEALAHALAEAIWSLWLVEEKRWEAK